MKNMGMVRKVDELGRIVIPKEIRSNLFIKEGTPMEIIVGENFEIKLKKCNLINNLNDIACKFCEVLFEVLNFPILLTDDEQIICAVGVSKKNYLNKQISAQLKNIIHKSENYTASNEFKTTLVPIVDGEEIKFTSQVLIPIMLDGKCIGLIVLLSSSLTPTTLDIKTMQVVSKLLTKELENWKNKPL